MWIDLAEETKRKIFQVSELLRERQQEDQLREEGDQANPQVVLLNSQVQHVEVDRKVVPKKV